MAFSNYQKSADSDNNRRKYVFKIMIYLFILFTMFLIILVLWITQPLIFKTNISNTKQTVASGNLEKHVRKLSEDFYPRNFANLDKINQTADYIKAEFEKTNGTVSEQSFRAMNNEYRNIIVKFGDEANERIVIGAHYDSCFDTPGADDNASGVAGLIELAKLFSQHKPRNIQVELIAYTLEEPPFFSTKEMGSYIHAKSLSDNNKNVRLMLSLEMIGYFSDEANSQQFPIYPMKFFYPNKGDFIALVGNFTNVLTIRELKGVMTASDKISVYSINAPSFLPGIDFSDHKNYWNFGYDAVMITDTAFYRNKNYHTKNDTADTLDYKRMADVVEATFETVNALAEN